MKINVSSDEYGPLVRMILDDLKERGHTVQYYGPGEGEDSADWPETTTAAVRPVARGEVEEAIVICWTGTGASIAANKVKGIRAALCQDAATARGARIWNHANVLALSMRATALPIAREILDEWFQTNFSMDDWNKTQIDRIRALELEK